MKFSRLIKCDFYSGILVLSIGKVIMEQNNGLNQAKKTVDLAECLTEPTFLFNGNLENLKLSVSE